MQQEQIKQLNVLCVGQRFVGKSTFLQKYTQDQSDQQFYRIYAKKTKAAIIYFHQISGEEQLYLQADYDAILYFADIMHTWKIQDNILKWVELYSKNSGNNVFKIPISIIAVTHLNQYRSSKFIHSLHQSLLPLIQNQQIVLSNLSQIQEQLVSELFDKLGEGRLLGLKCTQYTYWKLYGVTESIKNLINTMKIYFFRFGEVYDHFRKKNLRGKKIPT